MRYTLLSMLGWLLFMTSSRIVEGVTALYSYGKIHELRRRGHKVGRNVRLRRYAEVIVIGSGQVEIGNDTEIAEYTQIIVEDGGILKIGDGCYFSRNIIIGCSREIRVGDNVAVGGYSMILDINKRYDDPSRLITKQGRTTNPISIGSDVWIGGHVSVLAGASIGAHSVIGASSLVRGEIPSQSVAVGVPARVVKRIGAVE